jgi:hypothetical protein
MLISEIADPVNDSSARFIELANSSNALLDLSGWELSIYANANTNPASTYTFDDFSYLMAGQTFVIAQNASAFNTMYGFNPDASAALFNSNGDDNFELRDQNGVVVDRYGEPGVDQSGNCAEFTDGRALRTVGIITGNPIWNDLEWIVRANVTITGCSDHANAAQTAPADFSPGIHPN